VVGVGLLGGSVALAARKRGVAGRVVGVTRGREAAERARALGIVDEAEVDLARGVADADLVVLATPVNAMAGVLSAAAPHLVEGALVTDVGSVKGCLAETLPGLLPAGAGYVGAHPMAGSHLRGFEHASADLFEGRPCVVTPVPGTPPEALQRVTCFWAALGARVLLRDPGDHDREVAWVSHVPHALAFAFAYALSGAPAAAREVRGRGFEDFTRIALSDAELWADILTANRKPTAAALLRAAEQATSLARLLEAGDAEAVERFLSAARENLAEAGQGARETGADHADQAGAAATGREGSHEDRS
jgi:prephenate dehydrogenase